LAIHHAVANGEKKVVELLIEHGADLAAATADGDTPLHIAARTGTAELVQLLLSHGANPDAKNHSGLTPSDCAAGQPDVLEALSQGAAQ
jgi:ankyrin repeat protein